MTIWDRVQGDVDDTIILNLNGVADLNAAQAVRSHVWLPGQAATILSAAVTNPATSQVTVQLGGWLETTTAGRWLFETQVTFSDGTVLTWPTDGTDEVHVRVQGA